MAKRKPNRKPFLVVIPVVVLLAVLAGLGWYWLSDVMVEQIEVRGARYAERDALISLAGADTGTVLVDVDPVLMEDRLRRHPWVAEARVRRLPTGTLVLAVQERWPTVLVVDRGGAPSHYLDRQGFQMPLAEEAVYDVPLLSGLREPYHPVKRIEQPEVRAMLDVLAEVEPEIDALISEIEVRSSKELWLYTTPVQDKGAIPVRLGKGDYARKLERLHAFWQQSVLMRKDRTFNLIDLRFNSQIVTKEKSRQ